MTEYQALMLLGSEDLISGVVTGSRKMIEQTLERMRDRDQQMADVVASALRKAVQRG